MNGGLMLWQLNMLKARAINPEKLPRTNSNPRAQTSIHL